MHLADVVDDVKTKPHAAAFVVFFADKGLQIILDGLL